MLPQKTREALALARQGTYQGASDVLDHYIHDTLAVEAATTQQYLFFQSGIQTGKNQIATNLQDNGKLPSGQSYVLAAFGFSFLPGDATALTPVQAVNHLYEMLRGSLLELKVAGTDFQWQGSGSVLIPNVAIATADAVNTSALSVGQFNSSNWIPLNTPVTLSSQVSFNWRLTVDTTDAVVAAAVAALNGDSASLRLVMRGTLERLK